MKRNVGYYDLKELHTNTYNINNISNSIISYKKHHVKFSLLNDIIYVNYEKNDVNALWWDDDFIMQNKITLLKKLTSVFRNNPRLKLKETINIVLYTL